jgi:PAS domain S-box-containing protein
METRENTVKKLLKEMTAVRQKLADLERAVSEQRRVDLVTRSNGDTIRPLFESVTIAIAFHEMIYDETGKAIDYRIIDVNPAYERQTGLSHEYACRKLASELYGTGKAPYLGDYEKVARTGESYIFETYFPPMAKYFSISVISPIRGFFATVFNDITDRKRAEEALRESEQRLSDIFDFLPDATFAIDRDGKVIAWNRAIEDMTGVVAQDIIGKGNYEYALPFYRVRRPILIDLVFKSDEEIEKKYYFVRREGDVLLAEADAETKEEARVLWGKARPLYNSKGEIVGAIESIRDITDRKRMEGALRESERRLSDIIDFLPDATLAIDTEGKVIAWNRAIEDMTGVMAQDMIGKGGYEYAVPFYGLQRPILIDLVFKSDKEIENKYYFVRREEDVLLAEADVRLGDETRVLWGKARPLYNSKGEIVGAIESMRDVTDRKRMEGTLRTREKDLEAKTLQLEDLNAALRVLLKKRDDDRKELEEKMLINIKTIILPYIEKLKGMVDSRCATYVDILRSNLQDIISPFAYKLSGKYLNLTDREIRIADLIKDGKTTKEIAEVLNISESGVNIHRYRIRQKLGLGKKSNLRSHLSSLS